MKIDFIGQQGAVVEPHAEASAKVTVMGGKFQMQPAILVPDTVNSSAVMHTELAKQASGIIPLANDSMRQSLLIGNGIGKHAVLVPGAAKTVPAAFEHGDGFTQLTAAVEGFLD